MCWQPSRQQKQSSNCSALAVKRNLLVRMKKGGEGGEKIIIYKIFQLEFLILQEDLGTELS